MDRQEMTEGRTMERTVVAELSSRPMKPVRDEAGTITGWRGHAYDRYKRVFYATVALGEVIAPLMAAGGGQRVVLRYLASSTLAYLASAEDPALAALIEPIAHERMIADAATRA
jgi:hypothetical protein